MEQQMSHKDLIRSRLTLAEIEKRLVEQGFNQDAIDTTLAFIVVQREGLSTDEDWIERMARRQKPS
ncbi:MAG: hypothetical protein ABJA98_19195 [Acidobacteriota bacterium]